MSIFLLLEKEPGVMRLFRVETFNNPLIKKTQITTKVQKVCVNLLKLKESTMSTSASVFSGYFLQNKKKGRKVIKLLLKIDFLHCCANVRLLNKLKVP